MMALEGRIARHGLSPAEAANSEQPGKVPRCASTAAGCGAGAFCEPRYSGDGMQNLVTGFTTPPGQPHQAKA
jgi:hypothetical protein